MSSARIFFAGMGTTILLIGIGFGGGLILARTAMEPAQQNRLKTTNRSTPDRVILPTSAEAPPAPSPPVAASVPPTTTELPQARDMRGAEKDKQVDRADQRKAEAAERERRRHYAAERKSRREAAARLKQWRDQQEQEARHQERPGIMAFGLDENQPKSGGFFGN